jgi:hypothetical protein
MKQYSSIMPSVFVYIHHGPHYLDRGSYLLASEEIFRSQSTADMVRNTGVTTAVLRYFGPVPYLRTSAVIVRLTELIHVLILHQPCAKILHEWLLVTWGRKLEWCGSN